MSVNIHKLATIETSESLRVDQSIDEATGVWSIDDVDDGPTTQPFEITEQLLDDNFGRRFGRTVYWLTHRAYRREVRDRASHLVKDVAAEGSATKQVLPPRTRDFKSIHERRLNTRDLALDMMQYIHTVYQIRRLLGALALTSDDSLHVPRPLQLPLLEQPNHDLGHPTAVIEQKLPAIDGEPEGDGDYIAKIIVKS